MYLDIILLKRQFYPNCPFETLVLNYYCTFFVFFFFFLGSVINESVAHRNVDLNIIIVTTIITVRLYGPDVFPYELRIPSSI